MDSVPFRVEVFKFHGASISQAEAQLPQWENLHKFLTPPLCFCVQHLSGRRHLQPQTWNSLYTLLEYQTSSCVRMKESWLLR